MNIRAMYKRVGTYEHELLSKMMFAAQHYNRLRHSDIFATPAERREAKKLVRAFIRVWLWSGLTPNEYSGLQADGSDPWKHSGDAEYLRSLGFKLPEDI